MKNLFGFWIALFLVGSLPARAASQVCYSPDELRAEQALRLHSELMVITVTCRQGSAGQDLPAAYGSFTKKNITFLHDAEQTLVSFYRTHGKGNPLDNLDRLRTKLGNEFGQKAADMSSAAFCSAYQDKVVDYSVASPGRIEDEVHRMETAEHSYVGACSTPRLLSIRKMN